MQNQPDTGLPHVSVIVRAFNEEEHLGRLLEGIFVQKIDFTLEVILVDSGSTDGTLEVASGYPVKVVHIAPEDFSFGRSLNVGIAEARAEICVIVSAHCYPMDSRWIPELVAPFSDAKTALVYGRQRGGQTTKYSEEQIFARWFPAKSVDDYQVSFCNNANSAIRRKTWESHPFDEELTGLEDIEWARRVRSEGYRISYRATATVYHVHDESRQQIYNRYYREALAYRQIYTNETFRFYDFARFFLMNTFGDSVHALRDGCFIENAIEIPVFRFLQFWATYRAHTRSGISKDMQRQLYYPRLRLFRKKSKSPKQTGAAKPRIYDISRPLSAKAPVWPGAKNFSLEWTKRFERDGVNESHLSFNLHTGTHMDAPFHFAADGARLEGISLDALIGKAQVLQYFSSGPIDVSFFEAAEIANDCRRLLLRTRNSLPQSSAIFDPNFVAVSSESAQWLVDRGIELIGIDGPSIQPFHDEDNRVHQVLLAAGVIVLEGLDLKDVEPAHYHLTALPLNIPEAEGAPVRAILAQEEAQ